DEADTEPGEASRGRQRIGEEQRHALTITASLGLCSPAMARRKKPQPATQRSAADAGVPAARATPSRRDLDAQTRSRGRLEVAGGAVCLLGAVVWTLLLPDASPAGAGPTAGVLA